METTSIRLSGIIEASSVDGPGLRFVIFTQGCNHRCKGCHNPETWNYSGGYSLSIQELGDRIISKRWCKKITFSGGEPLDQASPCLALLNYLKDHNPTIRYHSMVFTGYLWEELIKMKDDSITQLLSSIDLLVDGPFIETQKSLALMYRGSKNQRIIESRDSISTGKLILSDIMKDDLVSI